MRMQAKMQSNKPKVLNHKLDCDSPSPIYRGEANEKKNTQNYLFKSVGERGAGLCYIKKIITLFFV